MARRREVEQQIARTEPRQIDLAYLDQSIRAALAQGIKNRELEVKDGRLALSAQASSVITRAFKRATEELRPERSPRSRAPVSRNGEAFLVAKQKLEEKYAAIGGPNSPLGLPVSDVQAGEVDYYGWNFRGGYIGIRSPLSGGVAQAYQNRVWEVYWKGLICYIKQEGGIFGGGNDEVYGVVGAIIPSQNKNIALSFPDDRKFWDIPHNQFFVGRADLVYSGPPVDMIFTCSLVEHDSGDTSAFQRKVAQRLSELGGMYLQSQGMPAEEVGKSQFFLDELARSLVSAAAEILGTDDDAYVPQQYLVRWNELGSYGWAWDPTPHNRNINVTGTDQGGDRGDYSFLFEIREHMISDVPL